MLTTSQVAELLNVKRVTVLKWIEHGLLPAHKHGRDWMIDPAAVQAFQRPKNGRPPRVKS